MEQQLPAIDPTNQCTIKQWRFAREYISNGGNGTQAARDAGYSGSDDQLAVRASQTIRIAKVQDAIDRITRWNADAAQVTPEYVIGQFLALVDRARSDGDHANTNRALENLARTLGMFDKASTIQTDQFQVTIQRVEPTITIDGRATLVEDGG